MAVMNKYPYEQRAKTYQEAINTFGPENQEEVAVEEMAELTKEICKNWRGKDNRAAIAEEIADVTIMLEQLRIIFDVNNAVCDYMDAKIERLHMRIQEHLYRAQ